MVSYSRRPLKDSDLGPSRLQRDALPTELRVVSVGGLWNQPPVHRLSSGYGLPTFPRTPALTCNAWPLTATTRNAESYSATFDSPRPDQGLAALLVHEPPSPCGLVAAHLPEGVGLGRFCSSAGKDFGLDNITGIEPATYCVACNCSNQMSYMLF